MRDSLTTFLATLTLLGWGTALGQGDAGKVLKLGVYFEPSSLYPHAINKWGGMWMMDNVYDTFVRFKSVEQDGQIVGTSDVERSIAEAYEISDDGRTYTFSGARHRLSGDGL